MNASLQQYLKEVAAARAADNWAEIELRKVVQAAGFKARAAAAKAALAEA